MDRFSLQIGYGRNQAMKVQGRPLKVGDYHQDISSVKYDPSGKLLAVGSFDGSIKLYETQTGSINTVLSHALREEDEQYTISSVRWRPYETSAGKVKSDAVISAITSNGLIQHYQLNGNRGSQIVEIQTHRDQGWSLNAMDYACDGEKFCVAGEDYNVHVYDFQTSQLVSSMHSKGLRIPGHKNRVFSVKGHPNDPNIVVSGGWDSSLKIYDIRTGNPIASIGGPYCAGDSIDIYDDIIVTGSTRYKDHMQMFSLSQMDKIYTWSFNERSQDVESGYIMSTRFSNDGNFVIAGGAGKNELRVFQNNADTTADFKMQMSITDLASPVYTIDANPNKDTKQFTFGCSNGQIQMVNYDIEQNNEEFQAYEGNFRSLAAGICEERRKNSPPKQILLF